MPKKTAKSKSRSTYEVPSDPVALSKEWQRCSGVHYQSWEKLRELCDRRIERMLSQEEELAIGEPTYEVLEEGTVVYKLPSCKEIKEVATALKVAIDGQRTALDMQFKSDRVAIGKVQQLGFILQLPDGAIEVDPTYAVNSTESTEENQTDIIDIDPK